MINEFLFFQDCSDTLEFSNFFGVVEKDAVGANVEMIEAALAQFTAELGLVAAIELLHVQDEFVQVERIIVKLSQLDLPRANLLDVIEDMLPMQVVRRALSLAEARAGRSRAAKIAMIAITTRSSINVNAERERALRFSVFISYSERGRGRL